jgi:hypothetical protein
LDPTFGTGGILYVPEGILSPVSQGNGIAVDANGSIFFSGGIMTSGGVASLQVGKINSNGTLNSSFGSGGLATVSLGTGQDLTRIGNAILPLSNGNIITGGSFINANGSSSMQLNGFTSSGGTLSAFGSSGQVRTDWNSFFGAPASTDYNGALSIINDPVHSTFLVGGVTNAPFDSEFTTPTERGAFFGDYSYLGGNNGAYFFGIGEAPNQEQLTGRYLDVMTTTLGSRLVGLGNPLKFGTTSAGYVGFLIHNSACSGFPLCPDDSFTDGSRQGFSVQQMPPGGIYNIVPGGLVTTPGNNIISGGSFYGNGQQGLYLNGMTTNGGLDSSFGPGGTGFSSQDWFGSTPLDPPSTPSTSPAPLSPIVPSGLLINPSGTSIIMGGTFTGTPVARTSPSVTSATTGAFIARFTSNGTLDRNFGYCGIFQGFFGSSATINAIAMQPDGKTVAVGTINGQTVVMRFLTNQASAGTCHTNFLPGMFSNPTPSGTY